MLNTYVYGVLDHYADEDSLPAGVVCVTFDGKLHCKSAWADKGKPMAGGYSKTLTMCTDEETNNNRRGLVHDTDIDQKGGVSVHVAWHYN